MMIVDVIWQNPVSTYAISACEALVALLLTYLFRVYVEINISIFCLLV